MGLLNVFGRIHVDALNARAPMTQGPIAVSIREATTISGIGRTSIYRAIAAGQLPIRKFGSRTLILMNDLQAWVESMPAGRSVAVSAGKTTSSNALVA